MSNEHHGPLVGSRDAPGYEEIRGRYPGLPSMAEVSAWKPSYKWAYETQAAMLNPAQYDWPHLPWQVRVKIIDAIRYGRVAKQKAMTEADEARKAFSKLGPPTNIRIDSKYPNGLYLFWDHPTDWMPDGYTFLVRNKGQKEWRSVNPGGWDFDKRKVVLTTSYLSWDNSYQGAYEVTVAAEKNGMGRHIGIILEYPPPPKPKPVQQTIPVETPEIEQEQAQRITEEIPIVDPPPVITENKPPIETPVVRQEIPKEKETPPKVETKVKPKKTEIKQKETKEERKARRRAKRAKDKKGRRFRRRKRK